MKPVLLVTMMLVGVGTANAQERTPDYNYDGPNRIQENLVSEPLLNERVPNRTPIFDNAPFLALKVGDQLMEGQRRWKNYKAGTEHLLGKEVFLRSDAKLYRLNAGWEENKLMLRGPETSPLFEWKFSLEHAKALYSLRLRSGQFAVSIEQWKPLKKRLQKEMLLTLRDDSIISPLAPFVQGETAIFEELLYIDWLNRLLLRRTGIATNGVWGKDWFVVVGPDRVDESETRERDMTIMNGPGHYSPGQLEKNRRNYAMQQRFRKLVGEFIPGVAPQEQSQKGTALQSGFGAPTP